MPIGINRIEFIQGKDLSEIKNTCQIILLAYHCAWKILWSIKINRFINNLAPFLFYSFYIMQIYKFEYNFVIIKYSMDC
jgi:hypothetical protein